MKLDPLDSQLLFVGTAGIGLNFGQIAPQVRMFDVFYTLPPVVGLQIIGEVEDE